MMKIPRVNLISPKHHNIINHLLIFNNAADLMSPEFIDQYIHDDFVCDLTGDEMSTSEKKKVRHGKEGWKQLLQDEMRFEWHDYEYTILCPCPESNGCDVRQTYQLVCKGLCQYIARHVCYHIYTILSKLINLSRYREKVKQDPSGLR